MIKKKLKFFLIILLLTSCSFDKKTGIWSGSEKEKRRISELEKEQKSIIEVKKIYSTENIPTENISKKTKKDLYLNSRLSMDSSETAKRLRIISDEKNTSE